MDVVIKVAQFLLSISLLVLLHELGHFVPAKLFKTKVEKFYLFFDYKFSLFKKKIGDTVYGIGWIPLGGYVKIAGMIDESMDTEQMKKEPQPWEFRSKPAWQRLIIMAGGVIVNIIVAFIIYIGYLSYYGKEYLPMDELKDGVWITNETLADKIGLKTGDKIQTVDGKPVIGFRDAMADILVSDKMEVERNGQLTTLEMPVDFIDNILGEDRKLFFFPRVPYIVGAIDKESANLNSGLKVKDQIVSMNGKPVKYYDQAIEFQKQFTGQDVQAVVLRDGKEETLRLTINEEGRLGVRALTPGLKELDKLGTYSFASEKFTFLEAIPEGGKMVYEKFTGYFKQVKKIANPETGAYKGVGGMISMTKLFPPYWDWKNFWSMTAYLSIMLAFLNLLPIPALDGGHIVFLLYEMISGRKPSQKIVEMAQMIGFFILLALLIYANGKDVFGLFSK
jgi:regulator of sigma E protease